MSRTRRDVGATRERHSRAYFAWTAVLVVVGLWVFPTARVPDVASRAAPETEFSAERALGALQRLLDAEQPHPGGSAEHARVRERLLAELARLDVAAEVQETLARGPSGRIAVVRNVLAELPGTLPGKAVLVASHYDSVGSSPGAADDGAGVAAALELARALRSGPPLARTVILLFSDAEEVGLVGASAFVEQHRWAPSIGCVVNLEARGTSGPSLMFETSGPSAALAPILARSARRPFASSVADLIYKLMPNDTDLSVFRAREVPGFNFAFIDGLARYHTPRDDLAHLDARSVQHQGEQALALVRELALVDLEHLESGDAVFFDIAGRTLVHWRPASGVLVALGLLALALFRTRSALVRSDVDLFRLLGAPAGAACAVLGALLFAWCACTALGALHGVPDPGAAHPQVLRAALAFGVAAVCTGVASFRWARRTDFAGAWHAAWIVTALGSVAAALFLPRASHLVLVACAAWSLADVALRPAARGAADGRRALALAVPLAVQLVLWLAIGRALEACFGFRLGALGAAPLALLLALTWPALIDGARAALRALALSTGVVGAVLLVVSAALPATSFDQPGWLNLRYVFDAERGSARFEASTFGAALPDSLAQAAPFTRAREAPFPWLTLDRSMFVAPAEVWDVAAPELRVLESHATADGRNVRVSIRSPRGAPRLHLHLPAHVEIASVRWGAHVLRERFRGVETQLFFAVPPEGLELELQVRGAEPARVHLLDQDWTLPESLRPLQAARPLECVPRSDGDVSMLGAAFEL